MGPLDYTINIANPIESALKGYQQGIGINQLQQAQSAQQAAMQQKQQQADIIQSLVSNPNATADDYSKAMLVVPGLSDQLKQAWATKNTAQQQSQLADLAQWGAAIQSKNPKIAVDGMNERARAMENANGGPTKDSEALRAQAQALEAHPEFGGFMIKSLLAAHPEGSKVIDGIVALSGEKRASDQADADLRSKNAAASKAEAEATVAQATIPEQIAKPASELATAEQKRRLDQFNAEIAAADSETKRGQLTLERDKYVAEQGLKQQESGQAVQGQLTSTNNAIETATKLLNDPLLKSSVGIGSAIGKLLSYIPGTDNKDYRSNIETLKAQLFIPAIAEMKSAGGAGALSDAEGKKLSALVASLDSDMSPQAFKNNLGVIIKNLSGVQQRILADKRAPTQGGAFVTNHPNYGPVREGDINRLMKQHPGATRDQVLQFLNQTGAK